MLGPACAWSLSRKHSGPPSGEPHGHGDSLVQGLWASLVECSGTHSCKLHGRSDIRVSAWGSLFHASQALGHTWECPWVSLLHARGASRECSSSLSCQDSGPPSCKRHRGSNTWECSDPPLCEFSEPRASTCGVFRARPRGLPRASFVHGHTRECLGLTRASITGNATRVCQLHRHAETRRALWDMESLVLSRVRMPGLV